MYYYSFSETLYVGVILYAVDRVWMHELPAYGVLGNPGRSAHSYHCTRLSPSYTGCTVAGVGAVPRQQCQSKTTKPIATAHHTTASSKTTRAVAASAAQSAGGWMIPWVECATTVMSTLPPVRLNNHVYQNVIANVVSSSIGRRLNCANCGRRRGACQTATTSARIRVANSGERSACRRDKAKPRHPGSSPSGPSRGLIRRTANTTMTMYQGLNWASEGAPAPSATLSPIVTRKTASGSPIASAYQIHLARQRIIRPPRSRSPAQPWVMGITMRAATSGPNAPKDPNGKNPHAIA